VDSSEDLGAFSMVSDKYQQEMAWWEDIYATYGQDGGDLRAESLGEGSKCYSQFQRQYM
jgi:hypothetical protein